MVQGSNASELDVDIYHDLNDDEVMRYLEAFVVENDELYELEKRIGRFNIFDALGIVQAEIRHSNFLAWLLDPNESHGQRDLFLRFFLTDLLRQTPAGESRLFSPVHLDGAEIRGVTIRREWRNIDILITCESPAFVVAIENKIRSREHSNQLQRYQQIIESSSEFGAIKQRQYVYLTREGDEPSESDWTIYSYADLHRTLTRCRDLHAEQLGEDVLTFLNHYLRLVGSRFMDDARITELCQTIYRNHRQAIDLIIEHGKRIPIDTEELAAHLSADSGRWVILRQTSRSVDFIPASWQKVLPPISANRSRGPIGWLGLSFYSGDHKCYFNVYCSGVTDDEKRQKVVSVLLKEEQFKLDRKGKLLKKGWNSLSRINIAKWPVEEPKEFVDIQPKLDKMLDEIWERLSPADQVIAQASKS